jgi:ubiquinone/menaquinone biosynthesis C-methylase UbiE
LFGRNREHRNPEPHDSILPVPSSSPSAARVRQYWNAHIHDLDITRHPVGSAGFFADLDAYHFEKLHHLLRLVDFDAWRGKTVVDVGCGAGVEVVRFARGGADVVGVDVAEQAIALTRQNLAHQHLQASLVVATGEALPLPDESADLVYAHGIVQYAADDRQVIGECRRILREGGVAVFQVYNRISWLNALSTLMKVPLEHEDAPVLRRYSIGEFHALVGGFRSVEIVAERFPVKSRLHKGWKGALFNAGFVGTFNALPRRWVRRFGWHLLGICRK